MPKAKQPVSDPFASVDLGALAGVTGGCGGGHRRRHHCGQQPQPPMQPPYGPYGNPPPYGSDPGYDVTTNVDVGQGGQSIIRR